jgi:basic membrane protein A and related proteins
MLRRLVLVALVLMACLSVIAAARPARAQNAIRVKNVINGTLPDKSFFDSAERGLQRAQKELGIEYKTIELGEDANKWEPGLDDAMADTDSYDILITGTFQMADFLTARADNYPDKKFIIYDTDVDRTKCKCANVYGVVYAQNEGSYLAGVYAAGMMKDGTIPNLSGKHLIGAVGGLDIPVINDFIVGYEQGAKSVDPEVKLLKQYVGGDKPFFDPAKGKEIALSMYEQGADFVFGIAGGSGQGIIDAAKDKGKYTIGVDSDQATIIGATDPKAAQQILTSMQKNVDNSLFRALSLAKDGKLPWGQLEEIGLAERGVGLSKNDIYNKATPDTVKKLVEQAEADIVACKITVATAFDQPRPCNPAGGTAAAATPAATASQ